MGPESLCHDQPGDPPGHGTQELGALRSSAQARSADPVLLERCHGAAETDPGAAFTKCALQLVLPPPPPPRPRVPPSLPAPAPPPPTPCGAPRDLPVTLPLHCEPSGALANNKK